MFGLTVTAAIGKEYGSPITLIDRTAHRRRDHPRRIYVRSHAAALDEPVVLGCTHRHRRAARAHASVAIHEVIAEAAGETGLFRNIDHSFQIFNRPR